MTTANKLLGCFLGAAVGDAMGAATETRTREMIQADFGGYLRDIVTPPKGCFAYGLEAGWVTDDFSLAYDTAVEILKSGGVTDATAANALLKWSQSPYLRFAGPTTQLAIETLRSGKKPEKADDAFQLACDNHHATNGAAMKIWSVGLVHPGDMKAACDDTLKVCLPTHRSDAAIAGACAVSSAIAQAMAEGASLENVLDAGLYGARYGFKLGREFGDACAVPSVEKRMLLAMEIGRKGHDWVQTMTELGEIIGSGLSAAESIPCAFGILAATPNRLLEGIEMGVNIGNDTDTIASIVGAIGGALYGAEPIPARYLSLIESVNHMPIAEIVLRYGEVFYHA